MRIGIFTPRSLDPLHPRLVLFHKFLQRNGFDVKFINESNHGKDVRAKINWVVLWLIDLYAVHKCRRHVQKFDIILITDLKYLSLARYAKHVNKIVIYDTI